MRIRTAGGLLVVAGAVLWHLSGAAQGTAPAYTAAQAEQGKAAFAQNCASCHGANLDDGPFAPPLKGGAFMQKFGGKSADGLFTVLNTMPPASPGTLGAATYAQILAYLLQSNTIPPVGTQELPSDPRLLAAMTIPAATYNSFFPNFSPYTPRPPAVAAPSPFDKWTSVTDALLANPPASEWLAWRRTQDAHGFSPLSQINKTNVSDLRVAWSWSMPAGITQTTPIVHDGVMFVQGLGDKVVALDARTGDLLWQYVRPPVQGVAPTRKQALALYGDRVYIGTSDVHLVALEAKTGKVVWDTQVGDRTIREGMVAGPIAAKGKILIGTTGTGAGAAPGGPHIVGVDAATGAIAWKVGTIAQPGSPGGESWNGVPMEKRSGASVWTAGSYDPALNLAFFGTGNTYDTGPLLRPVNRPGITNEGLYTATTLAIDPDTGKVAWHFQHLPNDQWDLDWAFERQLVKLPVNGQLRTVAITAGKMGIYEALDATTGQYLFSVDSGLQNVITAIDPKTGAKTINPAVIPGDGQVKMVCPHPAGARNFMPGAYNPNSKIVFTPMSEACMDLFPVAGGGGVAASPAEGGGGIGGGRGALSSGVNWGVRPRPDSDGKYGRVQAMSLDTKKVLWTSRQRAPQTSGILATGGGLVFASGLDRFLRAYDDATGQVLWSIRLNDVAGSSPISYAVNGKQYLAFFVSGGGGFQSGSFLPLVPELRNPSDRSAMVWVFEVPEKRR